MYITTTLICTAQHRLHSLPIPIRTATRTLHSFHGWHIPCDVIARATSRISTKAIFFGGHVCWRGGHIFHTRRHISVSLRLNSAQHKRISPFPSRQFLLPIHTTTFFPNLGAYTPHLRQPWGRHRVRGLAYFWVWGHFAPPIFYFWARRLCPLSPHGCPHTTTCSLYYRRCGMSKNARDFKWLYEVFGVLQCCAWAWWLWTGVLGQRLGPIF
jgi:hypothetical protein